MPKSTLVKSEILLYKCVIKLNEFLLQNGKCNAIGNYHHHNMEWQVKSHRVHNFTNNRNKDGNHILNHTATYSRNKYNKYECAMNQEL